jgi:hypothetical protein
LKARSSERAFSFETAFLQRHVFGSFGLLFPITPYCGSIELAAQSEADDRVLSITQLVLVSGKASERYRGFKPGEPVVHSDSSSDLLIACSIPFNYPAGFRGDATLVNDVLISQEQKVMLVLRQMEGLPHRVVEL